MLPAKFGDCAQIERVPERVRHEYRFGFVWAVCLVELAGPAIERQRIIINEYGHEPVLKNGRYGGRKSSSDSDDLIPRHQAAFAQSRTGKGARSQQVGRGAGIAQDARLDSEEFGQTLFKCLSFFAKGKPKVQCAAYSRRHLVFGKYAPRIGNHSRTW